LGLGAPFLISKSFLLACNNFAAVAPVWGTPQSKTGAEVSHDVFNLPGLGVQLQDAILRGLKQASVATLPNAKCLLRVGWDGYWALWWTLMGDRNVMGLLMYFLRPC
jgi:hypothetical protein